MGREGGEETGREGRWVKKGKVEGEGREGRR